MTLHNTTLLIMTLHNITLSFGNNFNLYLFKEIYFFHFKKIWRCENENNKELDNKLCFFSIVDDFKLDNFFHNLELTEMDKNEKQDLKQIASNTVPQSASKEKLDKKKTEINENTEIGYNNKIAESIRSGAQEVKTSKAANKNSDTTTNPKREKILMLPKEQCPIPEPSTKTLNMIQEEALHKSILNEVRRGEYNLEIAPSDLVDFGGQKAFDMTHQLFILQGGTVLLLFDGSKDLDEALPEYHGEKISSAGTFYILHLKSSETKFITLNKYYNIFIYHIVFF